MALEDIIESEKEKIKNRDSSVGVEMFKEPWQDPRFGIERILTPEEYEAYLKKRKNFSLYAPLIEGAATAGDVGLRSLMSVIGGLSGTVGDIYERVIPENVRDSAFAWNPYGAPTAEDIGYIPFGAMEATGLARFWPKTKPAGAYVRAVDKPKRSSAAVTDVRTRAEKIDDYFRGQIKSGRMQPIDAVNHPMLIERGTGNLLFDLNKQIQNPYYGGGKATEGLAIGQQMSKLQQLTPDQIAFARKFKPEIIEKWETLPSHTRSNFRELYSRYLDEGKPVDFKFGAAKLSETKLQKSTEQKKKIEEVTSSADYQKSGTGTKQELLDAGVESKFLKFDKWDKVFEHLDNLEPGSLVSAKGLSRELFDDNPNSAPTIRGIVDSFYPSINLAKTKEDKALLSSLGGLKARAKMAAEPVSVPTARRNTEGVFTRIDWPDGTIKIDGKTLSIEDAYIKKLKDIYSRPKENRTNYELAELFWNIKNPTRAELVKVEKVNSFLVKELNLVKEKADPSQTHINRINRINNAKKYLSLPELEIVKRINNQVTVINKHFINNPTDILNYPKIIKLIDARLEATPKVKAKDKVNYTGEIVYKTRKAEDYIKKAREGILDLFHIDAVGTGKRNIEYPRNLLLSPGSFNQGFLNQVDQFFKNTKPTIDGKANPVFENGVRNISNLLEEVGLTYVVPGYGKIGAKELAAIDSATNTIPSVDRVKKLMELPDLTPTWVYKPRSTLDKMYKNYPTDLPEGTGLFMPTGKKQGGRVGYKKGGTVKPKINPKDYIVNYSDGTKLYKINSFLRDIARQIDY